MTIGRTRMGPQGRGYLHTTDATADQLVKAWEIPFKHTATVTVWIVAIADTGDYLFERSTHLVTRDGAAASYVGEVSNDTLSSGAGAWVTTIDCTGTTLRLRFTGEAAHVCEVTAVAVFDVSAVNVPIVWECATTDQTQSWAIRATAGVNYWYDWGDGSFDAVVGSGGTQVTAHNYAAAGMYAIRVMIEDATDFDILYANDNELRCSELSLAGTGLLVADLYQNELAVPFPALPASLRYLSAFSNYLSGDMVSLTPLASLAWMLAYSNRIAGYTASTIAASCDQFQVQNNLLPQSAIDQILADFETGVAGRPAAGTISLGGTGNAAPSAAGLASKAAILAAKPAWVITHN